MAKILNNALIKYFSPNLQSCPKFLAVVRRGAYLNINFAEIKPAKNLPALASNSHQADIINSESFKYWP